MYHLAKAIYLRATSRPEYSILVLGLDAAGKTTLLEQIKNLYSTTTPQDSTRHLKTVPTVGQNMTLITLPDVYLKIWDVGGQQSLRGLWASYYAAAHAIVFVVDSTDVGDADIAKLASYRNGLGSSGAESSSNNGHQHNGMPGSSSASSSSTTTTTTTTSTPRAKGTPNPATATPSLGSADLDSGRLEECAAVLNSVMADPSAAGVPLLVLANKQDREDCVEVMRIKEGFVRRVVEGEKGGAVRDSRVLPCSALTGAGVREAVEWVCSRVKWNKESRPPVMR